MSKGPDEWKRDWYAKREDLIIERQNQAKRNAAEWMDRATRSIGRGECDTARNMVEQAIWELQHASACYPPI